MKVQKLAATLALVLLAGCTPGAKPDTLPTYRFKLGPRDLVRVSVWGRPELTTETEVGPDGRIAIPLAGVLPVNGLTLEESAERIGTRLKEFIRDPIVTVEVRDVRSAMVFVVGEVRLPGIVAYHDGITFLEAIQRSGGYVHELANVSDFLLVRDPLGHKKVYRFDMDDLLTSRSGQRDVFLLPGDIVYAKPRYVTEFAWWIRQVMAPIQAVTGTAMASSYAASLRLLAP